MYLNAAQARHARSTCSADTNIVLHFPVSVCLFVCLFVCPHLSQVPNSSVRSCIRYYTNIALSIVEATVNFQAQQAKVRQASLFFVWQILEANWKCTIKLPSQHLRWKPRQADLFYDCI